jgi:hypothetical protein
MLPLDLVRYLALERSAVLPTLEQGTATTLSMSRHHQPIPVLLSRVSVTTPLQAALMRLIQSPLLGMRTIPAVMLLSDLAQFWALERLVVLPSLEQGTATTLSKSQHLQLSPSAHQIMQHL